MNEKTKKEIEEILDLIKVRYNIVDEDLSINVEIWENQKLHVIVLIPNKLAKKLCTSCKSKSVTQWFNKHYPDSAIAHISFASRSQIEK